MIPDTPWKINGWNLEITHFEGKCYSTPSWLCSMLIFRGVDSKSVPSTSLFSCLVASLGTLGISLLCVCGDDSTCSFQTRDIFSHIYPHVFVKNTGKSRMRVPQMEVGNLVDLSHIHKSSWRFKPTPIWNICPSKLWIISPSLREPKSLDKTFEGLAL